MGRPKTNIYLNGKLVLKKNLPKGATLKRSERIANDYYETIEYTRQQAENASNYFNKLREDREELEARHG